ncbi:MAG: hypothetical protein IKY10_02050, partial [Clostridia bacterium]|nr:hypothetical protein [Clostridia bacterium]
NYLINYARFANYINANINVNKNCDLKFSMIDVYTNVVMSTFNNTKEDNQRVVVYSTANINLINNIFNLDYSFIETEVDPFDISINYFIQAYYNCNKTEFAKNLSSNVSVVSSATQDSKEKVATYYFKQIFKI